MRSYLYRIDLPVSVVSVQDCALRLRLRAAFARPRPRAASVSATSPLDITPQCLVLITIILLIAFNLYSKYPTTHDKWLVTRYNNVIYFILLLQINSVVFVCTWRGCGYNTNTCSAIEAHIRNTHLG